MNSSIPPPHPLWDGDHIGKERTEIINENILMFTIMLANGTCQYRNKNNEEAITARAAIKL